MRRSVPVLIVVLAACSSSASKGAPATNPPAHLRTAVEAYVTAFGRGDGRAAWAMVSARCKGAITETDYRATVAAAGVKYKGLHLVNYTDSIDGSAATATYDTSSTDLTYKAQRWVLETGAWRWDGC